MKKFLAALMILIPAFSITAGQSVSDPLMSKCLSTTGTSARYLKDYRVQLGQSTADRDFRYKAKMSLWKNTKYRFSLCTADNSRGVLILAIWDEGNKEILSSIDSDTGKAYSYVDFICNKSGVYQVGFDFTGGQSGLGVSIVSMIQ
ncbi:MAG: hypothetical protein RBT38_10065 [Bacteroidales bacterium]|jgi:hypothetical protein|nr:hypothetical protein [Bacteroidales bacterium]